MIIHRKNTLILRLLNADIAIWISTSKFKMSKLEFFKIYGEKFFDKYVPNTCDDANGLLGLKSTSDSTDTWNNGWW